VSIDVNRLNIHQVSSNQQLPDVQQTMKQFKQYGIRQSDRSSTLIAVEQSINSHDIFDYDVINFYFILRLILHNI